MKNMKKALIFALGLSVVVSTAAVPTTVKAAELAPTDEVVAVEATSGLKITSPTTTGKYELGLNVAKHIKVSGIEGEVTYTSSNKKVVYVSSYGKMTGKGLGTCTITVTSKEDPTQTATLQVTVKPAVTAVQARDLQVGVGSTATIKTNVKPAAASQKLSFVSLDPSIATVNWKGEVTGVSGGTTKIKCRAFDGAAKSRTITVTVTEVIAQDNILMAAGDQTYINATQLPPSDAGYKYFVRGDKTEDGKYIIGVSKTGRVKAYANGEATITVMSKDGSSARKVIKVTVGYPEATKIEFTKDEGTTTANLAATMTWESGAELVKDIETIGAMYPTMQGATYKFTLEDAEYVAQYTTADGVKVMKLVDGVEVDVTENVKNSTDYSVSNVTITLVDSELGDYVSALIDITAYAGEAFGSNFTIGDTTFTDVKVVDTYFMTGKVNGVEYKFFTVDGTLYAVGDVSADAELQKLVDKNIISMEYVGVVK